MSVSFIHCENLVKIYKVDELEVVALQGLDLEVLRGEFLAIVGASGSGKSSLLNMLGGLDRPSAGRLLVGEQDLLKLSDQALARYRLTQVGFVWQQSARNLLPYLTAQENVELPMVAAGATTQESRQHAQELLEAVGLADRRRHRLAQLSGGQQQRVAMAVALANRPQLLLADEPTGEVDSATAQLIWQSLRQLSQRYGLTVVIVTHDRAIARVVDRVVSIRDGKTSTETVRHPQHTATQSHSAEHFQERVVLDLAGRVQLPRDYLTQRGIKSRATVELVADGILVRALEGQPVASVDLPPVPAAVAGEMPNQAADQQDDLPEQSASWWRRLWPRRLGRPTPTVTTEAPFSLLDFTPPRQPAKSIADDSAPIVVAEGLSRRYQVGDDEVQALRGVDLRIDRRRLVVFKGRSGSGKTTLLNLIGGLDRPSSGRVTLFGQDLSQLSEDERTQLRQERIGFVFQSFSLMPTFSAVENVEMLLRVGPLGAAERRERALACLTLVGLRRWADHRPFEMSGGQQQRLSIARALACGPEIIIADEPTSNLDSETGRQVLQLFQRLVTDGGFTVLMASHDPATEDFATDMYELSDGVVTSMKATPKE
ncbi:MAG: ATP-binding cassette domain-containing protein [Caldilinea sp. CFX5]|nr:ATP-binding cassette domain-containing protein [Caldilinea sp. CFX5]